MYCVKCGNEIKDGVKFCSFCGEPQETISEAKKSSSSNSFNFHSWIIENGLESYEQILREQDLDTVDVLSGITIENLDALGIDSIGGQKKILNAIQKLKSYENTNTYNNAVNESIDDTSNIPDRCPRCGEIWGKDKETSGAGNTLGKALVGGLLLGPLGVVGGAAFGNKTTVYLCRKCGFRKEFKSSVAQDAAKGIKKMFK